MICLHLKNLQMNKACVFYCPGGRGGHIWDVFLFIYSINSSALGTTTLTKPPGTLSHILLPLYFQIGHIQYLSTLIKDDRKFFRKKFGTQFFLDVVRVHYASCPALNKDDCKTIRASLFGLVKFYLQKDVSSKDVLPIVNFILTVKQEGKIFNFVQVVSGFEPRYSL